MWLRSDKGIVQGDGKGKGKFHGITGHELPEWK
jgi:hypothetical protein